MKKKRGFLGEVLIVLFTVFLVMSMNSSFAAERSLKDMKPTVWRTQSITPLGHYNTQVYVRFAEEVARRTNGKLKIEVHASGGLGHPLPKTVSVVRDGLMEVGQLLGAFVNGEFPFADVMELPGLVPEDMELRMQVVKALTPFYEKVLLQKYNQYFLGAGKATLERLRLPKRKLTG